MARTMCRAPLPPIITDGRTPAPKRHASLVTYRGLALLARSGVSTSTLPRRALRRIPANNDCIGSLSRSLCPSAHILYVYCVSEKTYDLSQRARREIRRIYIGAREDNGQSAGSAIGGARTSEASQWCGADAFVYIYIHIWAEEQWGRQPVGWGVWRPTRRQIDLEIGCMNTRVNVCVCFNKNIYMMWIERAAYAMCLFANVQSVQVALGLFPYGKKCNVFMSATSNTCDQYKGYTEIREYQTQCANASISSSLLLIGVELKITFVFNFSRNHLFL